MTPEDIAEKLSTIGTYECRKWSGEIFGAHRAISIILQRAYIREARARGYVRANHMLRKLNKRLLWNGYSVALPPKKIESLSIWYANKCLELYERSYALTKCVRESAYPLRTYIRKNGLRDPFPTNWANNEEEVIEAKAKRLFDEKWWARNLTRIFRMQIESVLRDLGLVSPKTSSYISKYNFGLFLDGRVKKNEFINNWKVVSDDGEEIPLRVAHDASVSNPEVQRSELMVRMRGMEDEAKANGLSALFITMTCPSKYHARDGRTGRLNPNYQGYSHKDGQTYLVKLFSHIRADLNKKQIKNCGFRICEPHVDATPHFHLLLYVYPEDAHVVDGIFRKHCLKEDGDELGADQYRCDVKHLDLENGSATGYIAKYIAKNIDGAHVGEDLDSGEQSKDSSIKVKPWASLWGIRQFQEIGNISKTVYREFRRLPSELVGKNKEQAEAARRAADEGDYAAFIRANGGLFVKRKEVPFRALHIIREKATKFGEDLKQLIGIVGSNGIKLRTRTKTFTLVPNWMVITQEAARPPTLEYCQ